ncbi:MAG: hypothetical protein AAF938_19275 [Myxococcota bacterium]
MTFRRERRTTELHRRWRAFRQEHRELFEALLLPHSIADHIQQFDYFLMHGCHPDAAYIDESDFNGTQRDALRNLVREYLSAGFDDPGIAVLSAQEIDALRPGVQRTR